MAREGWKERKYYAEYYRPSNKREINRAIVIESVSHSNYKRSLL